MHLNCSFFIKMEDIDDDPFSMRISEDLILFRDGVVGYDFHYESYICLRMFEFQRRCLYDQEVKLLLQVFEDVIDIARMEQIDDIWVRSAEVRLATCRQVLRGFRLTGGFTQWRKLFYHEHQALKSLIEFVRLHEYVGERETVLSSFQALSTWKAEHPDPADSKIDENTN